MEEEKYVYYMPGGRHNRLKKKVVPKIKIDHLIKYNPAFPTFT